MEIRSVVYLLATGALLLLAYQLLISPKEPYIDVEDTSQYPYNVNVTQRLGKKVISESQLRHPNCYRYRCPWKNYTLNDLYEGGHSPFQEEEDTTFNIQKNEWPLYCRPDTFGYDNEEAAEVFPYKGYPKCITKFPQYESAMHIDPVTNTLVMNCSGEFKGRYVLGDSSFNSTIRLPTSPLSSAQLYTGPVPLHDEEWALGTCDPTNENLYEQIAIHLRRQDEVYERAASTANKVAEEAARMYGSPKQRRTLILLLAVDSASRRHFYRKLPKTVELLRELQQGGTVHVADFLIHNIIGDNSARNQIPVFTGKPRLVNKAIKELEGTPEALFHGDALQKQHLMHILGELGFVTLLSFEFCHQYFATYMGDQPSVDHLVANFWCGAKKYAGFNFEKSVLGQRCIGPEMSHQYMFTYLHQFMQAYNGANQLLYSHVTTPHEATGTQIETLDDDLVTFLRGFLDFAKQNDYDFTVFLHGDHGMRYGEWYKNIKAFQEHRLPALFTLVSTPLVHKFESFYDTVEHNRKRLVGKLDLYLTIKTLAMATYLSRVEHSNPLYDRWRKGLLRYSVSIFLEKIMNNRSCGDIHIPTFYCSCMKMELLEPDLYEDPIPSNSSLITELGHVVDSVVKLSLFELNSATHTSPLAARGQICQRLTLKTINSVYAQRISLKDEAFKVEFSVNEHPSARFETYTILGVTEKLVGIKENQEGLVPAPAFFRGRKKRLRIMFIKRLDSYAGLCEEVAYAKGINAALCICESVTALRAAQPQLLAHLLSEVEPTLSALPGAHCEAVCEAADRKCDGQFMEVLTDVSLVQAALPKEAGVCTPAEFTALLRAEELMCLVRRRETPQTCASQPPQDYLLLCPCH